MRRTSYSARSLRFFVGSFAIASLLTAGVNVRQFGYRIPEAQGILFRPAARFGDLADPLRAVANGLPYAQYTNSDGVFYPFGQNYPPGFIPLMRALGSLSLDHAAILTAAVLGATLFVLVHQIAFALAPQARLLLGVLTLGAYAAATQLLDFYPVVLIIVSAGIVLLILNIWGQTTIPLLLATAMPFAVGFPTIFAVDRMNIDIAVFAIAVIAMVALRRGHDTTGMSLIGIAAAMKIYPAYLVVGGADAPRWRWVVRLALIGVGMAVWSVVGILMTQHGFSGAIHGFRDVLNWYDQTYSISDAGMEYSASLLTGLKFVVDQRGGNGQELAATIFPAWRLLWIPVCMAVALVTILLRYPIWARLTIVTAVMLLASPVTGSYRCLFLLIPIAIWIASLGDARMPIERRLGNYAVAVLFGVTLAPKSLWGLDLPFIMSLTSETLLMPAALLLLVAATVWAGLPRRAESVSDGSKPNPPAQLSHSA